MARRQKQTRLTATILVLRQWLEDVSLVLQKPAVAIALFMLGIVFVVMASKQVKMLMDYMESYGFQILEGDSILSYFLVVYVVFFVWLDVMILIALKTLGVYTMIFVCDKYAKIRDSLEASAAREEVRMHRNLRLPHKYNLRKNWGESEERRRC